MKIQEIAEKAGVSTATVSRVFSHHPNIREEIRERVLSVAHRYGYHPRLSTKQRNIVIVTPKSLYPIQSYVEMVLSELASELAGRGYRIEILPADNMERLDRIQFCGAAAIGMEEADFPQWDERFALPLVLVDKPVKKRSENIFSVHSDEIQAMDLAITHFAENGCRKIGSIIHGMPGIGNVDVRVEGIQKALRKNALPISGELVRTALPDAYVEEIGKLLRRGIDALFCPGGNAGIIAAYALSLYNRKVPEEIALIASERTIFSRYGIPPQTTISQDYPAQAKAVADVLERSIAGEKVARNTVIPYHLIERDSVMKR